MDRANKIIQHIKDKRNLYLTECNSLSVKKSKRLHEAMYTKALALNDLLKDINTLIGG